VLDRLRRIVPIGGSSYDSCYVSGGKVTQTNLVKIWPIGI
jgi:hypothetical protein